MSFVTASILILGLAYIQVNGNGSEEFEIFKQAHINARQIDNTKKFCPQNVCIVSERETEDNVRNRCSTSNCIKRALQDDVGPFWANRGKKDPNYRNEPLYAEEPHWVLVRRAQDRLTPLTYDFDPFFITRGKKDAQNSYETNKDTVQAIFSKMRVRNRRDSGLKSKE